MQKIPHRATLAATALFVLTGSAIAHEDIHTRLKGYEEVPAVSSGAIGRFKANIDKASQTIRFEISYSGLEGTVTQSHIHIGQRGVNGGITIWLCQTGTNPAPIASTPTCPQSGTVSGTLSATDVTPNAGAIAQGIAATEFAEVLAAIRAGAAYVNVHSSKFPGGEIRGQLRDDD
ncbi:MAG: CHRD domain-containing protein [Pseudomonadota bacterium]